MTAPGWWMRGLVVGACGVFVLAAPASGQLDISGAHVSMADGEISARLDAARRETTVTLALRPEGPHGMALLLFLETFRGDVPTENPDVIQIYGYLHTVNPTVMRRGMVVVDLDASGESPMRIDLTSTLEQPRTPAGELLDGVVEIAFIDFARLLRAETVSVNLLGLEFPLTPSQREALWAFAELVLPAGR